ncbi:uncharacterized protein LOC119085527 [Bradysia coprophila]|uniref:uncharacterized protein LOC119085527 n=1 Tax=Bradysia coprophila TaxID=38358 RepID=UPI00187D8079|nr:uncharacterized protein LOC119085527 [Bradysia coprophila]
MENLWRKEENFSRSVYVDLFQFFLEENAPTPDDHLKLKPNQKNNQRSTELRNAGNEKFLAGNLLDAMRYYNQSVCYAEIGSENIPLAYVNLSACFGRLQMHDKALRGIELAKQANLPVRMRLKVEQLEKKSQKMIDSIERRPNYSPKLSYEANANYTSIANVLEIKQNDVFGRHIVAKCDIPVGKIVLLEECFVACTDQGHDMCYTCYRQMDNFIPCPNCVDVLFCSTDCMNRNTMHKWECGKGSITDHIICKLTVEAILVAIDTFSGVENLMDFIDKNLCGDNSDQLPTSVHDAESKFQFYLKLTKTGMFHDLLLLDVHMVYNSILSVSKIAELFDSEDKQRFLMHLVAHIYYVNRANAIGSENIRKVINIFSMINHSCAPNLYTRYTGKVHHCITIRPVKKGEQLFINYLGTQKQTLSQRQAELKSKWNFLCNCDKCEPLGESIDRETMVGDPAYSFITENCKETDKASVVFDESENFLNKYAHTWSEEVEAVQEIYKSALILEHFKNTLQA